MFTSYERNFSRLYGELGILFLLSNFLLSFFCTQRWATNLQNEVVRCGTCYVWNGKILSKQGARRQKATLK